MGWAAGHRGEKKGVPARALRRNLGRCTLVRARALRDAMCFAKSTGGASGTTANQPVVISMLTLLRSESMAHAKTRKAPGRLIRGQSPHAEVAEGDGVGVAQQADVAFAARGAGVRFVVHGVFADLGDVGV